MNYLGHLLLTYPDTGLTMGNLLGDMIRAKQLEGLPENVRRGVDIHHVIDKFTDTHPGVRKLTELVRPVHGRYAPVVIDILLDHVLALQWEEHASIPFLPFTEWVYHVMVPAETHVVPGPVADRITSMARHRWLDGYPTVGGMAYVLARMDRRASFPSRFTEAMADLRKHQQLFEEEFRLFYAELSTVLVREFPGVEAVLSAS